MCVLLVRVLIMSLSLYRSRTFKEREREREGKEHAGERSKICYSSKMFLISDEREKIDLGC